MKAKSRKSSAELEREAQQKRQQIDRTLDEMNQELSPGQLLDNYYFHGESFTGYLRHLKEDPIPAVLIGTAIAWSAGGEELKHGLSNAGNTASEKINTARDTLAETRETAREKIDETRSSLARKKKNMSSRISDSRDKVAETGNSVRSRLEQAGENATEKASYVAERGKESLHEHPLMTMAVGFSLGAALGGLTPVSAKEREALATASRKLQGVRNVSTQSS